MTVSTLVLVTYFLYPSVTLDQALRTEEEFCQGATVSWVESSRPTVDQGPYRVVCQYGEELSEE